MSKIHQAMEEATLLAVSRPGPTLKLISAGIEPQHVPKGFAEYGSRSRAVGFAAELRSPRGLLLPWTELDTKCLCLHL